MVQREDTVILVTDSSKFGKKSFVRCAGIEKVDIVITDGNVDPDSVAALEKRGVRTIVV